MIVLALESSTSSAKAMLYDTEKGVLDVASKSFPTSVSDNGVSDTELVSQMTLEAGAEIARGKEVAAVALCGTWHNVALFDSALRPLGKTYSWNYLEPSEGCAAMRQDAELTNFLYQRTGCMPHTSYPRQALLYLKSNGLDLSDKRFLSQGGYTFYQLTGEYCDSVSTASGSGLVNVHSLKYDEDMLGLLGISEAQLPPIATYRDTRPLNQWGADFLGIPAGIPVVPAYPDGALNQISSCAAQVGKMTLSLGTSAAIRLTSDKPILPEGHQLWCYYGVTGWMLGAATAGAGNCINWFMHDCVRDKWSFEDFEKVPEERKPLPVFLPFLFGERCPGWQDSRQGGFVGIHPHHTVEDLYRGMQAGILFNLYQCFEILKGLAGRPEEILVSGGILNSPRWTQMLADIFGQEMACVPTLNASTMGAVILALHAAGAIDDVWSFRADYEHATRIQPRPEFQDYYGEQYRQYLNWYSKTL